MKLTIAIPTYNRNEILNKNISLLLPQLNNDCKLLIIDNHSDVPVSETLKTYISAYSHMSIDIVRNRVNIGGNANIMRCFEYCDTEYLWILSDDDPVLPNSVKTIFKYISNNTVCDFINFSIIETLKEGHRIATITTRGAYDFVKNIDSYGRVLLISSSVYRVTERLKAQLSIGNLYQYCCAPHLLTLIMALGDDGVCLLSHESIINHCSNDSTPAELQGSPVAWALGMPIILDAPITPEIRSELRKKLAWLSPFTVIRQLLLQAVYENKAEASSYYYRILKSRFFFLRNSFLDRLVRLFFDFLMLNPKMGLKIYSYLFAKVKGKPLNRNSIAGRIS